VEELNRHFEAIISEFLRTRKLTPTQGSVLKDKLGQYPSGWAWEIDHEGNFLWCSPELKTLLGYNPQELIGVSFTSLARTEESEQRVSNAISAQQPIYNLKISGRTLDGKPVTLLSNAILRKSPSSDQTGYRGVTQVIELDEGLAPETTTTSLILEDTELFQSAPLATSWEPPIGFAFQNGEIQSIGAPDPSNLITSPEISNGKLRIPILGQQNSILGVMEFERSEDQPAWTEDERDLANTISEQLAHAIQDTRSYQLTEQALDEMRKADQLKTEFLANMTHELRTPLNSIIGFSRVILKGLDGPITETQKQDLTSIYNAGQHLLGLINNILDFSKIETGKMDLEFAEVDLLEIIQSVLDTASGLVRGRPIQINRQVPEVLPPVWGNNIRIRQILLNLISNAIKFTDEGEIGITTSLRNDPREELVISVFDSGPGIAPEDMSRLFEPFSQLEISPTRKYGGTGLGLSICRHLVELHDGSIWVESTLGKGSIFHFTLPLAPVEPILEESIEVPNIVGIFAKQEQLDYQKNIIEAAGFHFHPISEVEQTIEVAETIQPDVILIDPLLPDGRGWKTILDIRENPKLQSVPIKTFSVGEDFQRGFDLGIGNITIKPLLKEVLEESVSHLLDEPREERLIIVVDEDEDNLIWTENLLKDTIPGVVRTATSGFEGVVATRQQVPDLVILNLFLANAGGFRLVESLRIDSRTRNKPVILMFPQSLTEVQIHQLQLWTNHCRDMATFPTQEFFDKLFTQIERIAG
jgi:PAS domain S-box-containing protein